MISSIYSSLKSLGALLRQDIPVPATRRCRTFLDRVDRLTEEGPRATRYDTAAVQFQLQGFMRGFHGCEPHIPAATPKSPVQGLDPEILAAFTEKDFLSLVTAQAIPAQDMTPLGVISRQAFLIGAMKALNNESPLPPYICETAESWRSLISATPSILTVNERALQKKSQTLGKRCTEELHHRWMFGRAAGFSQSLLNQTIHLRLISHFVHVKGWLIGCAERWQAGAGAASNPIDEAHSRLIHQALEGNDFRPLIEQVNLHVGRISALSTH